MKFAEVECESCGLEFKVVFSNNYPGELSCVQCRSPYIKVKWIDRAGFNKELK